MYNMGKWVDKVWKEISACEVRKFQIYIYVSLLALDILGHKSRNKGSINLCLIYSTIMN